jgi:hypothetical protein
MLGVKHFPGRDVRPRDSQRARDEAPARSAWLAAMAVIAFSSAIARADDAP